MNKKIQLLAFVCLLSCSCMPIYRLAKLVPSAKLRSITFSNEPQNNIYEFYYSDTLNNEYLRILRTEFKLDSITSNTKSELDKIKIILEWTNKQWQHNGNNNPSNPDALTILKEAKTGQNFRCVEYGIVASAALNSISIKARTLGLKTRDVEKIKYGAGHVVTEVYSKEFKKWIFIDPQFNVMPVLNNIPLNAVEFQNAIMNNRSDLKLVNSQGEISSEKTNHYIKWAGKYLFYFDITFDQRISSKSEYKAINDTIKITLVPVGEKEPKIFQRRHKIKSYYTHSLNDFYRRP